MQRINFLLCCICNLVTIEKTGNALNTDLKAKGLLRKIREHIQTGDYLVSSHALERQNQRLVDLKQVLYVLKTGQHEEVKDVFDVKRQVWKYAVCGKTVDGINLRIIVAFEESMIIITVVRLK